ncbi:MAG TPA: hypothetical protein VF791_19230 [Pyrinomonadaceae bacterium]
MSTEKNKWIDALGKLLTLTQEGQLIWATAEPPGSFNSLPHQRVDVVYQTRYKDRTLRLFELYHKVEKPKGLTVFMDQYDNTQYPYWTKITVLQLLDENGLAAWTFPETEVLNHLLEAVKYQVTGVKDFLDEILAEAV